MTLQHQLRPVVLSDLDELTVDGVCNILHRRTDLNRLLGFAASLAVRHYDASPVESSGRADDGDACGEVGEHVSLQAALDQ